MKTLAFALFLFGVGCCIGHVAGCKPADEPAVEAIENAAAVAQYKALLADCRSKGKTAKSYAVYEECANALDAHLCQARALRCEDGGAP